MIWIVLNLNRLLKLYDFLSTFLKQPVNSDVNVRRARSLETLINFSKETDLLQVLSKQKMRVQIGCLILT